MGQKKPSAAGLGRYDSEQGREDDMQKITSPDNKRKKQEDWNYLKQTLRSNNMMNGKDSNPEAEQLDQNLLTFHEKADELCEQEEELRTVHLDYLKEAAKLLTEEAT